MVVEWSLVQKTYYKVVLDSLHQLGFQGTVSPDNLWLLHNFNISGDFLTDSFIELVA